jgi:hypothetical protein
MSPVGQLRPLESEWNGAKGNIERASVIGTRKKVKATMTSCGDNLTSDRTECNNFSEAFAVSFIGSEFGEIVF